MGGRLVGKGGVALRGGRLIEGSDTTESAYAGTIVIWVSLIRSGLPASSSGPGQGSWTTPAQQPVVSTPSAMMTPGALLAVLQQDAPTEAGTDLAAADLLSGGTGQPGLGLDLFVPTKTKELIWHDHYVDFATLLPTHKHDGGDLQLRQADGSVFLTPARKTQPLTVTQWVSAFSTFMSIYVTKHPQATVPLLKYMQIVRGIAQRGGDFRKYDQVFRQLRQSSPMPWNVVHAELYLQVALPSVPSQPFRSNPPTPSQTSYPGRSQSVPRGFCFKYHSGRQCSGCAWKHSCFTCGGAHTQQECRRPSRGGSGALGGSPNPAHLPSKPNGPGLLPTPVKPKKLVLWLEGHPLAQKVLSYFTVGCSLKASMTEPPPLPRNHKSARRNAQLVSAKIDKELAAGRLAGPFQLPPFSRFVVSPLGLVPKKDGDQRLIHDLSFPRGNSVNSTIDHADATVCYASLDEAIQSILSLGTSAFLAKTDIASAFRIIPVSPDDYYLLGMEWQGHLYFDRCLPMGCASSCRIFSEFSSAIKWAAKTRLGIPHMVCVLDDFLLLASSRQVCQQNLDKFLGMCREVGIPMAEEKTFPPAQTMSFLGIELDVVKMEARLPADKLIKCEALVAAALRASRFSLRELQSLIGSLNFACRVVSPGRAFLRRLINLTIGKTSPYYRIRLTSEAKADLMAWSLFLQSFNGTCFFHQSPWQHSDSFHFYSDASKQGFGAVFGSHWLYGQFPQNWQSYDIWILELYALVVAFVTWQSHLSNQKLTFHCDNLNIVQVLNSCSSPNPIVMVLVRFLVVSAMRANCKFRAVHVPGARNKLSDYLSRFQVGKFIEAFPAADRDPTPVPTPFLPSNFKLG